MPDIAPCEPEPATDCQARSTSSPVTVTLNSVKPDLTMVWAADNTIWLLPAYTFGSADGGLYTVIAVDDAFIQQPAAEPATTEPVPAGSDPSPAAPDTSVVPDTGTVGQPESFAERWIGLIRRQAAPDPARAPGPTDPDRYR